ncbi:UvrD-helicase domain-containing protein [Myroides odoratimimus]|uniref:UvrD-helicase domain-containing protein n=1 Tax=Myroides odoratimimus TaxID=76832 RepID=UPI0025771EDB|nr:UvrD-helicase domain-containing protein [Myroides odoratimimus]MDM1454881.1 ATP-dependent helicase [Myroides odoratimimus]MDM1478603.1 ATP-dependent helicase [Myroides odoratimimus]MDM1490949.1 ATP-dependent helicase [Myroides odoratimimus]
MGAFEEIVTCIGTKQSYVVEAGAGAGKTYALIQTLRHIIHDQGEVLQSKKQKIICITYTNVAKNEIIKRIEYNDLVSVFTIHEFLWKTIKPYQKQLKIELCKLNQQRLAKDVVKGKESKYLANLSERAQGIESVFYNDSSFRDFEKGELHHDDVIDLSKMVFENYKLISSITSQKHPYILIDEYQDSSEDTTTLLVDYLLDRNMGQIVLGFYGDSHQKIYDNGIGDLEKYYNTSPPVLKLIKKEENYRSSLEVVGLLNKFRTNIKQVPKKEIDGSITFLYWKAHPIKGEKMKVKDFEDSLKSYKNKFYDDLVLKLQTEGWNFEIDSNDKILVLANSRIAERAGFSNLYKIFTIRYGQSTKEQLLDRNHILIKLFCGYIDKKTSQERKIGLEHLLYFWNLDNQNEVIRFIRKNGTILNSFKHENKKEITDILNELSQNRKNKTVKDVLETLIDNEIVFSKNYNDFVARVDHNLDELEPDMKERIIKDKILYDSFLSLRYQEVLNFWKHTQNQTVFSTKHGTKGDEYRNVLTVIDDTEWKQEYNFDNFFNNTEDKPERKLRTRNLFYVECSRAKENLVVLMLSKLSMESLDVIKGWFGANNVLDIEEFTE